VSVDAFPIVLSLRVSLIAMLIVAPVGVALAWLQSKHDYRGKALVDAVILLPLVLPPSVLGYLLVVLLGRRGLLGAPLDSVFGLRFVFTPTAAIIASCVVALPLLVKTAQPAMEAVPKAMEDVGRSLGLTEFAVFLRVTLPGAWRGILAGLVMAYARGLGEFGATLMFAGHIPGRTNTMPLEIFAAYQSGDDARAVSYVLVLTAVSIAVVLLAGRLSPRGFRS
jgi:molybdate transport system permease protein